MLIHEGIRHRHRKQNPFALRPSVPTHYIIYGIPSIPQLAVPLPMSNTKKTKPWGYARRKTKKSKSDSSNSRMDEQIAEASQRNSQSVHAPVICDIVESQNKDPHWTNIDSDHPRSTEVS